MTEEVAAPGAPPPSDAVPTADGVSGPGNVAAHGGGAAVAPALAPALGPTLGPTYELPSTRQVVGRGLQLALDASADIRRASLYVGFVLFLLTGPLIVTVAVELPRLLAVPWGDLPSMPREELGVYVLEVFGPLFGLVGLALFGFIALSVDGTLMAIALLGGRATGHPLRLREALQRSRQSFWRYGAAAFVVGLISEAVTLSGLAVMGGLRTEPSTGASLILVLASAVVTAPFGYFATGIVLGDVGGAATLSRSVTLARARPRLAAVVAAFAFAASALETFGLGAGVDVAQRIADVLHPTFGADGPPAALVVPVLAIAAVAFGSLGVTVSAIVAAPQVVAFLGLTHFRAGLDRARDPAVLVEAAAGDAGSGAGDAGSGAADGAARRPTAWHVPAAQPPRRARWISLPMIALIGLSILVATSAALAPPPPRLPAPVTVSP